MRYYGMILTSKQIVVAHCSAVEPAWKGWKTLDAGDGDISNAVNSSGTHFSPREYKDYQEN